MKPMIVLAGGFGTRLKPILNDIPKPLAPILNKPFIIYLLENWIDQGVTKFIFLLHYKSKMISETVSRYLKNHTNNIDVHFIKESKPLGTGGSIYNAINELNIDYSFLVSNADTWLGDGIKQISEIQPNVILTSKVNNTDRYGSISLEKDLVRDFIEKSNSIGPGYVSSGLYHMEPSIFKKFSIGSFFSIEQDIFPKLAHEKKLKALKLETSFIDIGIPSDYNRFCEWISNDKKTKL
jgi:D-glycero-alpha-D-manno-heptose 1-phosphate guanylyltransferase